MNQLSFVIDKAYSSFSEYLIKGAEHFSRVFSLDIPVIDEGVGICLHVPKVLPAYESLVACSADGLGFNNDTDIYLRELLFNPIDYFKGMESLIKDYDIQKGVNATFTHELMELVYRRVHNRKAHDFLMHYGGSIECVNNFMPVFRKGLGLEQFLILSQKSRKDVPCGIHKNIIQACLVKL